MKAATRGFTRPYRAHTTPVPSVVPHPPTQNCLPPNSAGLGDMRTTQHRRPGLPVIACSNIFPPAPPTRAGPTLSRQNASYHFTLFTPCSNAATVKRAVVSLALSRPGPRCEVLSSRYLRLLAIQGAIQITRSKSHHCNDILTLAIQS